MSELSSPPAHQPTFPHSSTPAQTQEAPPTSTNLVLIDPNIEVAIFNYERLVRAEFEKGLLEDERELDQILRELDVVRGELIVWSGAQLRGLDQTHFEKLESAGEEIKIEETNLTQTRSSVQHFLDSVKSAAFQLFGASSAVGATQGGTQT